MLEENSFKIFKRFRKMKMIRYNLTSFRSGQRTAVLVLNIFQKIQCHIHIKTDLFTLYLIKLFTINYNFLIPCVSLYMEPTLTSIVRKKVKRAAIGDSISSKINTTGE